MEIRHGLISCDSHGQLDKDAFTSRMSKAKWGDRIPQVVEVRQGALGRRAEQWVFKQGHKDNDALTAKEASGVGDGSAVRAEDQIVERWKVNGRIESYGGVCNCPAVMPDSAQKSLPQRWEEVPEKVYNPLERLRALDEDGVDGEVLFPNTPIQNGTFFYDDPEFELACVRAYNDALAEWRDASDRYIPLAILPYLSGIEATLEEVERAVKNGHGGIVMLAEPSMALKGLKHLNDRWWNPLWALCQDLDVPIHWHSGGGVRLAIPPWKGFTRNQLHAMFTSAVCSLPAQAIPNLMFSGILDRYPRLKWVCAESGLGWVGYVLEACDHEWERRHLWTEGIGTRPSDLFRRQVYVDFWHEVAGVDLRHVIGLNHIMWESDYPHVSSTYPRSWETVSRTLEGVPEKERAKLLYENAVELYKLE